MLMRFNIYMAQGADDWNEKWKPEHGELEQAVPPLAARRLAVHARRRAWGPGKRVGGRQGGARDGAAKTAFHNAKRPRFFVLLGEGL